MDAIAKTLQDQVRTWMQSLDSLFEHFQERQRQELAHQQTAFDQLRRQHESQEVAREDRLLQLIAVVDQRQDKHLTQIQMVLERVILFREDLGGLFQSLDAIARGEGHLIELQAALAERTVLIFPQPVLADRISYDLRTTTQPQFQH